MTKGELEKEAEEWVKKEYPTLEINAVAERYCKSYLAGVEPREKQIEIDAEQIRALQKQNGELTDKVKELEAQIEKMKCCPTCDNNKVEHTPEERYRCKTCRKFCNWELAD